MAKLSTRVLVQTDAGVVMGTSHYMSPEQARGKPVDAQRYLESRRSVVRDGNGRIPFEGETSTDMMVAITQKGTIAVSSFRVAMFHRNSNG